MSPGALPADRRWVDRAEAAWQRLIEPHPAVTDRQAGRDARMTAAILILIIPMVAAVALVVPPLVTPELPFFGNAVFIGGATALVLFLPAYFLSRGPHPRIGSYILVYGCIPAVAILSYTAEGTFWEAGSTNYLLFSSLLAGLLLPLRHSLILWPINFLLAAARGWMDPDHFEGPAVANTLILLGVLPPLLAVGASLRTRYLEEIRIEQRGRQTEAERALQILEAAPQAVLLVDGRGNIRLANAQAEKLFGYARAELVGAPLAMLVPEQARGSHTTHHKDFMAHPRTAPMGQGRDLTARRKDGTVVPVEIGLAPVQTAEGLQAIASVVDITVRKNEEAALRAAKEAAEQADRAKSTFLATMSHELRTPLNGILGAAQILDDPRLAPDQAELVATLRDSGTRLLDVLEAVLDYAQLRSGGGLFRHEPFDLRATVEGAVASSRPAAVGKGLSLDLHVASDVPQRVMGDSARLRQILLNLLSNATKFTQRGSIVVDLSAQQRTPPAWEVRVAVRDTGMGIASDLLGRLFRPFVQGDSGLNRRFEGTGLGLSISQALAEGMGGSVAVESQAGKGSTFTLILPLVEQVDASQAGLHLPPAGQLRVLVAEDNLANQKVIAQMLASFGTQVETARDGEDAVAKTAAWKPDVVLMDVRMPVMDGLAATRAIRARGGVQPRIIALTADALPEHRQMCLDAGMNDYLSKPVRLDDLERVLLLGGAALGHKD